MAENEIAPGGVSETIVSEKVKASRDELLNLDSPVWANAKGLNLEMTATPLANQPSPYIKATRDEKEIGKVKALATKTVHNGKEVFFRFEWASPEPNTEIGDLDVFPDGVSILFAIKDGDDCPIKEMGRENSPTNGWFWRADFKDKPKNQISRGLATSLYTEQSSLVSSSRWKDGTWSVIMGRTFKVSGKGEEAVQLKPGKKGKRIGFAAWEGANGERGGVKAFSKEWRELIIAS